MAYGRKIGMGSFSNKSAEKKEAGSTKAGKKCYCWGVETKCGEVCPPKHDFD